MKAIPAENYLVRPFVTHKTQTYEYTFLGGGNPEQVSVNLAVVTPTGSSWIFESGSEWKNPNGIYARPLFASINHLFYSSDTPWHSGTGWSPTGSQIYVISMAESAYGEGIYPGSFELTAAASTASIIDNGLGQLVSAANTSSILGNIFYGLGIAVLQQCTSSYSSSILSHEGLFLTTGSSLEVLFKATHTIYEHTAVCTMDIGEMNFSSNPSMTKSGSLMSENVKVFDSFASGTLTPYMTTVGLYTDKGELVAIGKFPRVIKRAPESQQTVVIKFDI